MLFPRIEELISLFLFFSGEQGKIQELGQRIQGHLPG
jgi:hypothetical protein